MMDVFNNSKLFLRRYKYPLLLVVFILVCLWPLTLHVFIPKWDNINGYLPYRYFISDYLWNGKMPLWNPFQRLGYPGYSDLQSGCWNPITWVIMLFGKYTIGSLVSELVLCYIIAGLGMYTLGNYFYKDAKTSFIIAFSYSLSGFMIGSSQLMVFLIGVAWLPWCIFSLLKFLHTLNFKYIILGALFVAMQTAAASPAYTIILIYIFTIIIGYFIWKNRKSAIALKRIIGGSFLLCGLIFLLLLPYINSFLEFAPYFNRIEKLPYKGFLLANPFTPKEYISFLFPYSVISATDIFNETDLTLRNGYFGIIGFIFLLSAIFSIRNNYTIPLIITIIISLILAAGSGTSIYKLAYQLPGFGVFRHPSIFRTYTIFSGLLLAGFALKNTLKRNKLSKKEQIILFVTTLVFGIVALILLLDLSFANVVTNIQNVVAYKEISDQDITTHLFINSIIVLGIGGLTILLRKRFNLSLFYTIVFFVLLDLGIQTQLTSPTTICYNFTYKSLSNYFKSLPNNIDQNSASQPLKLLNEKQGLKSTSGIWQNLSTFNKTLSSVGVNPFRFKSWDEAEESGALKKNLENEILFSPKKILEEKDTIQKGLIWGNTIPKIINEATNITNVNIGYNEFSAMVNNTANKPQPIILNQNYHHLWKAYFDNTPIDIYKVNDILMAVNLPKNSNGQLKFVFKSPNTLYAFFISLACYVGLTFYLLNQFLKEKKRL